MGPARNRYWLPLGRLSAFCVAVVAAGNIVLHSLAPAPPAGPQVQKRDDFYTRKKKKIERHFRAFQRFIEGGFFAPAEAPPPEPKKGADRPAEAEPLLVSNTGGLRLPEPVALAYVEPDPPAFVWPSVPATPAPREIDLPAPPSEFPLAPPDLVFEWASLGRNNFFSDILDPFLQGPEALFDGILALGSECFPRGGEYTWTLDDEREPITARILDLNIEPRQGRIFSEFMGRLLEREQRFFARFGDSYINTFGFEDGTAEVDSGDLLDEQRKILWDALRKTYLSKYKFKAEERIRDDAFYFPQWRGVDFVVLPPLMAGYLYYRGLEKKISMGPMYVEVTLEPVSKWIERDKDLLAGVAVEFGVKGFPVGLIVSAGLYDGDTELDFVGIGTSVGMVRKALALHRGEEGLRP